MYLIDTDTFNILCSRKIRFSFPRFSEFPFFNLCSSLLFSKWRFFRNFVNYLKQKQREGNKEFFFIQEF